MFLLVGYMIFLPVNITRVARAIDSRGYHTANYSISKKHPFFVLTGNVTYDNVVSFARELYNNSSEDKSTQIVILSTKAPSPEMASLLRNPLFNGRLFYLTGSCTSPNDLFRAKVHGARVCVIFRGPIESSDETHDHKVLMCSLAIKKLYPDVPLFAQVLNSTEKEAIISSICDRIFCIQELNLRLMARSCIAPGASTLIANIFRSYTPVVPSASLSPWVNEYGTYPSAPLLFFVRDCPSIFFSVLFFLKSRVAKTKSIPLCSLGNTMAGAFPRWWLIFSRPTA